MVKSVESAEKLRVERREQTPIKIMIKIMIKSEIMIKSIEGRGLLLPTDNRQVRSRFSSPKQSAELRTMTRDV